MQVYLEILKGNPLFRGLSEEELAAVLKGAGARCRRVLAEEYVLRAGDVTTKMGFVLAGSVLIIQEDLWGHRNIMARVAAGDIFAEVFAAAGAPLNVSVVAHEPSELLLLDLGRLMAKGEGGAQALVLKNLLAVLAKKTLSFNEKLTHLGRRTTREKLLSYLSTQALRRGSRSFAIEFNRQQLADYLCVDRAAMSAELSKLQREGLLRYEKNYFELKETAAPWP